MKKLWFVLTCLGAGALIIPATYSRSGWEILFLEVPAIVAVIYEAFYGSDGDSGLYANGEEAKERIRHQKSL